MLLENKTQASYLYTHIIQAFNLDEIRQLCLHMQVNFDELSGDTLSSKVQSLLQYLARRERINSLITQLEIERPHIDWFAYQPAEPDTTPPFKGLKHFTEEDSHIFFGRERLIEDLVTHLCRNHFLAVVGASGCGKSSIVRAGLIPIVRQGGVTLNGKLSDSWLTYVITPGDEPLKALAAVLTSRSESVSATVTLLKDMREHSQSLDLWLYRELTESDGHILIVIDQFEEIFSQCNSHQERAMFLENLSQALQHGKEGRLSLIICLRADFYTYAVQHADFRLLLETQQKIVGAMSDTEVRSAIEKPASQKQWTFQAGLVDTMMNDLNVSTDQAVGADTLPLLSHALLETWQRREGRMMTLTGYLAAGGVRKAIAHTADSIYLQLTPGYQIIAKDIFLKLTNLGARGSEDTRRHVSIDEIISKTEDADDVQTVLTTLISAQLVTIDDTGVTVTHEAIIREWPRLRGWLEENRENLHLHRQLTETSKLWQDLDKDASVLYRGLRLLKTNAWVKESSSRLSELEISFLAASEEAILAEERAKVSDRQRTRRSGLFGMFGGAIGFSFSFLFMYSSQIENQSLLAVLTLFRGLLGALGGLLFILLVDMTMAAYQGQRNWIAWLCGGLGGGIAFASLLFLDSLLKTNGPDNLFFIILVMIVGAVWGFSAGMGRVWLSKTERPLWQTLPIISLGTGLVLIIVDQLGNIYEDTSLISIVIVGALFPLSILVAAQIAENLPEKNTR